MGNVYHLKTRYIDEPHAELIVSHYSNNKAPAVLFRDQYNSPLCIASVNIPEYPLLPGEVYIKDYSENEGMLEALIVLGIIKLTQKFAPCGNATAAVGKLLVGLDQYAASIARDVQKD